MRYGLIVLLVMALGCAEQRSESRDGSEGASEGTGLGFGSGGDATGLAAGSRPAIQTEPSGWISFSEVALAEHMEIPFQTVLIRSVGEQELIIESIQIEEEDETLELSLAQSIPTFQHGERAGSSREPTVLEGDLCPLSTPSFTLSPNAGRGYCVLFVLYQPTDQQADRGRLVIESNDPVESRKLIQLEAGGGGPELVRIPAGELLFGEVVVGTTKTEPVVLRNDGDVDLVVEDIELAVDAGGTFSFEIAENSPHTSLPAVLNSEADDGFILLQVAYTPAQARNDSGSLKIRSSDSLGGEMWVPLLGSGFVPEPTPEECVAACHRSMDACGGDEGNCVNLCGQVAEGEMGTTVCVMETLILRSCDFGVAIEACEAGPVIGPVSPCERLCERALQVCDLVDLSAPEDSDCERVCLLGQGVHGERWECVLRGTMDNGCEYDNAVSLCSGGGGEPAADNPSEFRASRVTADSIELLWRSPDAMNQGYRLAYRGSDTAPRSCDDPEANSVDLDMVWSYTLRDLLPSTDYGLRLCSVFDDGYVSSGVSLYVSTPAR